MLILCHENSHGTSHGSMTGTVRIKAGRGTDPGNSTSPGLTRRGDEDVDVQKTYQTDTVALNQETWDITKIDWDTYIYYIIYIYIL